MVELLRRGTPVTATFMCPLWGYVTEVAVTCDEGGHAYILDCPLCQPGGACASPCEEDVRKWCESVGVAA